MREFIEKINSKSYSFDKKTLIRILLLVFVLGGIFGFIYEELFYRIDLGYFVKRGTTFGPWIPIYGFGSVLIVIATESVRKSPLTVFFRAALITGSLEYITGYVLYRFFELRLWDYNTEIWNWLNIGGFICFRSVTFFGISALLLQYVVHPLLEEFAQKCPHKKFVWWSVLPAVLFILDIILSVYSASKSI